ncbi:hypothetical protein [Corynebacterium casei]|uniref:hypothetical protein n=1 Tax=Corynebacterium casei TaxID=160386 RepID=UPI003FD26F2B
MRHPICLLVRIEPAHGALHAQSITPLGEGEIGVHSEGTSDAARLGAERLSPIVRVGGVLLGSYVGRTRR